MSTPHKNIDSGNQHIVHRWLVPTHSLLASIAPSIEELYKLAFVTDISSYFVLTSIAPLTWKPVGETMLSDNGDLIPKTPGVSDIGSPTQKFHSVYTKELHLDSSAIYVDGVPRDIGLGSTNTTSKPSVVLIKQAPTQANSTTTLNDISGLSYPLEANSVYELEAYIIFSNAGTNYGSGIGFSGPSLSDCKLTIEYPINVAQHGTHQRLTYPTNGVISTSTGIVNVTSVSHANTAMTATIKGLVLTDINAGDFKLQFKSQMSGYTINIYPKSILKLTKIQ